MVIENIITHQNGIALNVSTVGGGRHAGKCWIPVPDTGVLSDLLPHVQRYLQVREAVQGDFRGEMLDVKEPTWEAVAEAVAIKVAKAAEEDATRKARREELTSLWRAEVMEYFAGGQQEPCTERSSTGTYHGPSGKRVFGSLKDSDVTDEELKKVQEEKIRRYADLVSRYEAGENFVIEQHDDTIAGKRKPSGMPSEVVNRLRVEFERRRYADVKAAQSKREQEQADKAIKAAAVLAARAEWLREHGAEVEMVERLEAGVLPEGELVDFVRSVLLPISLGGCDKHELRGKRDIEHEDDCNYEGDCHVDFALEDVDTVPLTKEQWVKLKALRTVVGQISGTVQLCKHTASLSCDCPNPTWVSAKATVRPPDLALEVVRRYSLD